MAANLCTVYAEALRVTEAIRPPRGQKLGEVAPFRGKREDAEALMKWCGLAAQKNFVTARNALGYLFGRGMNAEDGATMPPDYAKAFFWIGRPIGRGGPTPFMEMVSGKLTPQQRDGINAEFRKWEAANAAKR